MQKCMKYIYTLIKINYIPFSKLRSYFAYTVKEEASPENSLELSKINHPVNRFLLYCSKNKRNRGYQVMHFNSLDRTAVSTEQTHSV